MLRFSLKKNKPSELELKIAMPLGIVFWAMSLVCLGTGVGLYGNTIKRYGRNSAIVQSGGKTRVVSLVLSPNGVKGGLTWGSGFCGCECRYCGILVSLICFGGLEGIPLTSAPA